MPQPQCTPAAAGQHVRMPSAVPDDNAARHFHAQRSRSKINTLHARRRRMCCGSFSSGTVTYTAALLLLVAALQVPEAEARKQGLKAASQCIQCSQCLTASCQRICSPSCRGGRGGGGGGIVLNGDQCKYRGEEAADAVADDACKAVQGMCQAGNKSPQAFQSGGFSASECAAIASGACQRAAQSSQNTPCGVYLYFGFRSCSPRQYSDMYKSRVVSMCKTATSGY